MTRTKEKMASKTSLLRICAHVRFPVHILARMIPVVMGALSAALAWAPAPSLSAATLPPGFADFQVATGLASPTAMAIAPDGRLFVCEQGGRLRVIKNGALLPAPFVSISVDSNGERGLLGVAFDPDFASNQFVYVYYTTSTSPAHNRVSRFTASGDVAAAGSEVAILEIDNLLPGAVAHNGGALHFGPDGKLYIGVGDNVVTENAQSLSSLKGKLLRINSDGTIPADNPFYSAASGNYRAIWALGLRNPFTFDIQPGTGRVFINDVGSTAFEEINDGIAGANYGWPTCEGKCNPPNPAFRDPIYAYQTTESSCAITGGAFYNPVTARFPSAYFGKYFFADLCAGWIKLIDPSTAAVSDFATISTMAYIVDLDVSADGDLYYLQRGGDGQVRRIAYTANQSLAITQHPASVTVTAGQAATFSVSASGVSPLSYQWRRDGVDIASATSASYTIASTALTDNGARFRCVVSNASGSATSNEATLTVTSNQPPVAAITTPVAGTLYRGGQTISYAGTGTDPETGDLGPDAFTWQVDFHHDTHTHPHVPPTSGATSGSFVIPATGETATNVWYRIHLTVTDPSGLSHSVYRDVFPRISTITLQTNPPGLQLTLDGAPTTTPASVESVVGINRTLGVVSPQNVGGRNYVFASWSDGGVTAHTISTPSTSTTYTATFATCGYTISPNNRTISPAGGTGTVSVTAAAGCPWTAMSNDAWIMVTAGSSGTGDGSVSYSVETNTGAARTGALTVSGLTATVMQPSAVTTASAASFNGDGVASESIVAAFGAGLATASQAATTLPLPTEMAGAAVRVRDSAGVERLAPLFFVAPAQINCLIPPGTAPGDAAVTVTNTGNVAATGGVKIAVSAPGLFSANANGQGVAAGVALRVKGDGVRVFEPIAFFDPAQNRFVPSAIDLGPGSDQVFLVLFGTGFRNHSSLEMEIGGTNAEVLYAGPQGELVGLDQVNVRLLHSLLGRGEVDLSLTVDGKTANTVRVQIR